MKREIQVESQPASQLGAYIRGMRRDKSLTLAEVSKQVHCSLGYISRIELGQVPDGPSAQVLGRIADVLGIDRLILDQLAQRDREQSGQIAAPGNASGKDRSTSASTVYLEGLASIGPGLEEDIAVSPAARQHLVNIAVECEAVAERFLETSDVKPCLAALQCAEDIYKSLEMPVECAIAQFRIARSYRWALYNDNLPDREDLEMLYRADRYFQSAHEIFATLQAQLTHQQRSVFGECLTDWAKMDAQLSNCTRSLIHAVHSHIANLNPSVGHGATMPDGLALEDDARKVLSLSKLGLATDIYERLLTDLQAEVNDVEANNGVLELIAETAHRCALAYAQLASLKRLEERTNDEARFISLYVNALEQARDLTLQKKLGRQDREKYLRLLIQTHLTFGFSMLTGRSERDTITIYPRSLWQFRVAQDLTALLPADQQPKYRKDAAEKLISLDQERPLGARGTLHERVESRLKTNIYGTLERPVLAYDLVWKE